MKVKIVNKSNNPLPNYQTLSSAGMDIRANLNETISLLPNQRMLIKTGLFFELPIGIEAQIRPRSGLALKNGITVLNSPGTIDADYRGEIGVLLHNTSDEAFVINDGDRIAQVVFAKHEVVSLEEVQDLNQSERGQGGFGSTGVK